MPNTWFTADSHFDHQLMADLRGFESIEDHDQYLIHHWNKLVKPGDIVWHLGDVGMGPLKRFGKQLNQLNGELHLIVGNHDECHPMHRKAHKKQGDWALFFHSVQAFARRRVLGQEVMLSHFPYSGDHTGQDRYSRYRLQDDSYAYLLHGHTHSTEKTQKLGRQIHVGMDAWDLKPVSLDEIQTIIECS